MIGSAVVLGAGVAGLAAAARLREYGWRVEVLERAAGLPESGIPLAVPCPELGGPEYRVRALHADGRVRAEGTRTVRITEYGALLRGFHEAAGDVVRFGVDVTDLGQLSGRDVVLAADGAHSVVRRALFGEGYEPRPVRGATWFGIATTPVASVTETRGHGARLLSFPLPDGRTGWFASARASEVFRDWQESLARDGEWLAHFRCRPLPRYAVRHIALLGDAAHPLDPEDGLCAALGDAHAVADALATAREVPAALTTYDRARRKQAQRLLRIERFAFRLR
ncbi:NAD(P)-binding protein [Sciscionella marina]|uniref:NAD(P)-binding protein n=1 Tax=Sciscionella marina TaxID=508770 RepID=UPI0003622657|nr:NAD(P)-binding protein [Sciscionella marina]